MVNLVKASRELYRREPDECYKSFADLRDFCCSQREQSGEHWCKPQSVIPIAKENSVAIQLEIGEEFELNDHSFRQLTRLCGVSSDTLNRLSPRTAAIALEETLPNADRPIQFLSGQPTMRSIHGINASQDSQDPHSP